MTYLLIALGVSLAVLFVIRRRKRANPQYDWVGRVLPGSCRRGYHDTPDMIVGMEWDQVSCMRCGFLCFAESRPIPAGEVMTARVAVAYWGAIYDKKRVMIEWTWPRVTRYTVLSLTDLLVGLQVEVADARKGEREYLLNISAGSVEIDGHGIDPLTFEVTRGQMAALILGEDEEISCPQGSIGIMNPVFFRSGWDLDSIRQLVIRGPNGNPAICLPLGHEFLGKVLRPWAVAAIEQGHVRPLKNGDRPVFSVEESQTDSRSLGVWSQPVGDQVEITQLQPREVDNGVTWRTTDDEVIVTVGRIRRADMRGSYNRDEDAVYASLASDGDVPLPETTWIDGHECRFPARQLVPIRRDGWGVLTLTGDNGAMLKLREKVDGGYRFAFGTLSHPELRETVPVGWTHATYGLMQRWAQQNRAAATY